MTTSRYFDWTIEDSILRDVLPSDFRWLLEAPEGAESYALEGLGALTSAVVIGTAAAGEAGRRHSPPDHP